MHEKEGIFWLPNKYKVVELGDISLQIRRFRVFLSKKRLSGAKYEGREDFVPVFHMTPLDEKA